MKREEESASAFETIGCIVVLLIPVVLCLVGGYVLVSKFIHWLI